MTTKRISELPKDRHFLDLSETCLYMVRFSLGPFFLEILKKLSTLSTKKSENRSAVFNVLCYFGVLASFESNLHK